MFCLWRNNKLRIREQLKHLSILDHLPFILLAIPLALRLLIPSIVLWSITIIYDRIEKKDLFLKRFKFYIMKDLKHWLLPDNLSFLLLLIPLILRLWVPSLILWSFTVIYDFLEDEIESLKELKTSFNETK